MWSSIGGAQRSLRRGGSGRRRRELAARRLGRGHAHDEARRGPRPGAPAPPSRRGTRPRRARSPARGPRSPRGRRRRARSARRSAAPAASGTPGPSSSTDEHDLAVALADLGAHARARRRVPQRVLDQVDREAVQLVAHAVDHGGLGVHGQLVAVRHRLELGGGLGHDRRPRRSGGAGRTRPASARASSSRSATRRRMRCEERSATRRPRPARPRARRRAARGSPARWSAACAARARRRPRTRAGARACPRSRRAPRRARASMSSQRPGQLGDLVLGLGVRDAQRQGSRVRSTSRAASVSSAIGAIARRAVARPASSASAAPAEHAEDRGTAAPCRSSCRRPRAGGRTAARPARTAG